MTRIQIQIQNSFRKMVAAELHDELTEKNEEEVKKFGKDPFSRSDQSWFGRQASASDDGANWQTAMYHASHFPAAQSWVIECNGATQGAIAFHESASPINGVKVLMISAIGSAPRNRRIGWNRYVRVRGFAGVGRALIRHANTVSINLGLNGTIGLYSAPQAEGFYEKVGLVKHGIADKRGFAYFESP